MMTLVPSPMQRPVLFLCLTVMLLTLGGCAFMSDEDRDFYGRGWVKPSELDQPVPHHSTGAATGTASSAPLPTTADGSAPLSTTGDPAWDVPGDHPR